MMRTVLLAAAGVAALGLAGCNAPAKLAPEETYGPSPKLSPPKAEGPIPTLNPAKAVGWPADGAPTAPAGFTVTRFAEGLDHPRWLYRLPNGDILVVETNSPPKEKKGLTAWVEKQVMKRAGAVTPSANRITLLRDADGDGVTELKMAFLSGLNSPFGVALVGDSLYVANTDAVLRFPYTAGQTAITAPGVKVADLPASPPNNHWTKNLLASPDGARLYIAVGSHSNLAEGGIEQEANRAGILELTLATGAMRQFASGLRNPVGMAWEPSGGALWTAVNERDMLGGDLVPDYMTSVRDGGFYGWPYSYFGQNVDERMQPQRPDLVARAIVPDYALGAHTASLGLAFWPADAASPYAGGALVGQHGSWNRDPVSGYKVVFIPFSGGKPSGKAQDFLAGFLDKDGQALGRPVGVAFDATGAVLVADDVGDIVWRVSPTTP
ncbi:MAG: sorbosone dehydrogenase family protein [Caulobacter sp.]|nr:sorbosone dehydrogenase family protein [Caulobacter sp.]